MKRIVNKILAGTLLACLAFNTSQVYANPIKIEKSDSIEEETDEIKETIDIAVGTHTEKFDIIPDHSYKYRISSGHNTSIGTITFEERAESIKLICRVVDTGKEIFSETYSTENENIPNEGIKTINFRMEMNELYEYEIEIKDEDTVFISGNIKLYY